MGRRSLEPTDHAARLAAARSFLARLVFREQRGRGLSGSASHISEEMAAIHEIARIVTSTLDIDQVYEKFAAEVKKLVDFDRMSINIINPDGGTFTPVHQVGTPVEGREVHRAVPIQGARQGAGLGLATCYGIVKEGGGDVRVSSHPGRGTTFGIYLPRVEGAATPAAEGREQGKLPRGTETVLLVEDEPAVRSLAALALRRQGYTVLEAANGEEALQVVQEHLRDEIQLLLSDVVMPRMGGRELAHRLKALIPQMRVLLTSGFPGQASAPEEQGGPDFPFLPKPFTRSELVRRVRAVLDRR